MDVIGNNIANVNTVGFKSGRVTFKEGFAQLLQGASRPPGDQGGVNPVQVGLGSQIGSVDQLFTQGNVETTGVNTDLAMQGDAFFVVRKGAETYYTRSGNFQLDAEGRMVSPTNDGPSTFSSISRKAKPVCCMVDCVSRPSAIE